MTVMLLQLSLCVVTVVQRTSSQPTYDVAQQDNDVGRCGRVEQMFDHLVVAVSQLQKKVEDLSGNNHCTSESCPVPQPHSRIQKTLLL